MNLHMLSIALHVRHADVRDVAKRIDPRWGMGQAAEIARWALALHQSQRGVIVLIPIAESSHIETRFEPAAVFEAAAHLFEVCANGAFWEANAHKPFVQFPRLRVRPLLGAFRDAYQEGDVAALEALIWWCGETPAGLDAAGLEPDRYDWPDDDHGPGEAHERVL